MLSCVYGVYAVCVVCAVYAVYAVYDVCTQHLWCTRWKHQAAATWPYSALFVRIEHDLGHMFFFIHALRIFTFLLQGDLGITPSRIHGAYAVCIVYAVDAVYAVYAVYAVRAPPLKLQKKGVPKVMFFFITFFKNLHFSPPERPQGDFKPCTSIYAVYVVCAVYAVYAIYAVCAQRVRCIRWKHRVAATWPRLLFLVCARSTVHDL